MDNDSIAYIELFGIILSGAKAPVEGLYWTDLEGWWGLPEAKSSGDSIPGAHGRYRRSTIYRDSRVVTLTGHILTESPLALAGTRHRLERALSAGSGEMIVAVSNYGVWSRWVEIDTLTIEPDHGRTYTKFIVDMIADPVRYKRTETAGPVEPPVTVGGLELPESFPWDFGTSTRPQALITNDGDVAILPRAVVTGSGNSVEVLGGGRRVSYGQFSGELVFDSAERRAWLNGVDVTPNMLMRAWHKIQPGETQAFSLSVDDPADGTSLSVEYRIGAW